MQIEVTKFDHPKCERHFPGIDLIGDEEFIWKKDVEYTIHDSVTVNTACKNNCLVMFWEVEEHSMIIVS